MDREEFLRYIESPLFKEDLEEASRCIREDDREGLVKLLSKSNEKLAKEAAERIRNA